MISFLRSIRQIAGAAIVVVALMTASSFVPPAAAFESAVAATLAAEAAMNGVVNLAANATPALAPLAKANGSVVRSAASSLASVSRTGRDQPTLNANAAMPATARHRSATPPNDRRIVPTRTSLNCSGEWCGRHFVLMLGVAY